MSLTKRYSFESDDAFERRSERYKQYDQIFEQKMKEIEEEAKLREGLGLIPYLENMVGYFDRLFHYLDLIDEEFEKSKERYEKYPQDIHRVGAKTLEIVHERLWVITELTCKFPEATKFCERKVPFFVRGEVRRALSDVEQETAKAIKEFSEECKAVEEELIRGNNPEELEKNLKKIWNLKNRLKGNKQLSAYKEQALEFHSKIGFLV